MASKRKLDPYPASPKGNALKQAYKEAKKAYRADKADKSLKKARDEAKKALQLAEVEADSTPSESGKTDAVGEDAATGASSTSGEEKIDAKVEAGRTEDMASENDTVDEGPSVPASSTDSIKMIEKVYQQALAAFKKDKSNKNLRRSKTAARRALDSAIAASADGGELLVCRDCSQKFIFSIEDKVKYEEQGWTDPPLRCSKCAQAHRLRRGADRSKIDGNSGQNMCYAFQRGECPHGSRCKFSHNPKHGGKRSGTDVDKVHGAKKLMGKAPDRAMKQRKEEGLRKKAKGWRNK